eukprot:469676-Pleurochrysis_carterae.AAC.1
MGTSVRARERACARACERASVRACSHAAAQVCSHARVPACTVCRCAEAPESRQDAHAHLRAHPTHASPAH